MCEKCKIDLLTLFGDLELCSFLSFVGIACEALDLISIFWEVLLPYNESTVYFWQGESNSTLGPVVSFYFSLCFTHVWRDLGVISWTESLCKSRNAKAISLWHDTCGSCRYWSKCLLNTLLLPLLCVFKIASPWCRSACSLPQPRPLPWQCSQGEDLGIEAVNG